MPRTRDRGRGRHYMMLLGMVSVWCPCNSPNLFILGRNWKALVVTVTCDIPLENGKY
jgi:hypothetical protein